MKVSSCNCHHRLICCSKSSVLYDPPQPPKTQSRDAQNVPSSTIPGPIIPSDKNVLIEQSSGEGGKVEILLKSNLKKQKASDAEQVAKGNVKWMDSTGKELVEVREFEPIELEEPEVYTERSLGCTCLIQ